MESIAFVLVLMNLFIFSVHESVMTKKEKFHNYNRTRAKPSITYQTLKKSAHTIECLS